MAELPDVRLPDRAWERILALLTPGQVALCASPVQASVSPWAGRPDEPHWAFVEPGTGRMLDTAECQELLRRLRHG